ncbi:MAG: AI-2E family transporter [Lachnospiraceae bacterium]|nr:AI-2E family transporter [Lachnospiraceae bacterium]
MLDKVGCVLHPLLLGILIAYIMEPLASWFQNRYEKRIPFLKKYTKMSRLLSVLSCLFLLLFILCLGLSLLSWNLTYYLKDISFHNIIKRMTAVFSPVLPFFQNLFSKNAFLSQYRTLFLSMAENKTGEFVKNLMEFLLNLPVLIGRTLIGLFIALYLLMDKELFLGWIRKNGRKLLPARYRGTIVGIFVEFQRVFFGYLKGQALDCLFMGIVLSVGLWLLHVPLGISIGILAGIGNLVPYLGPFIAYILTILFCLFEGKTKTLFAALIYLLAIQQIDGSIIGPKLLGNQIRLRPVFILISVLVGGTFFGPAGMILSVPFAGLIKAVYQKREILFFTDRQK